MEQLTISLGEFQQKLQKVKAFISDWDGVFNDGIKTPGAPSPFAEADSMGLNLLRYDFWLRNAQLPTFAIITGADNPSAVYLAKREKFTAVYSQIINKAEAVQHFCESQGIKPEEVACFFDDANDLVMAKMCGLRFLIRRDSSPLFTQFVKNQQLCDYVSLVEGNRYALREISENLLQVNQNFEKVLLSRAHFDQTYQTYYQERQIQTTQFFKKSEEGFVIINPS